MDNYRKTFLTYFTGILSGFTISYIIYKIKKKISAGKNNKNISKNSSTSIEYDTKNNNNQIIEISSKSSETELQREQLKRNYEYFGAEGMQKIKNSFVCVVGIGGVGSHLIMTL